MAKLIEVPGQKIIEFPDNMDDAAIVSVLQKEFGGPPQQPAAPEPTFGSEAARVAQQVRGGLLAIPGFIGDAVQSAWDGGVTLAGRDDLKFRMKPSEALEEITGGKVHKPQTVPGQYAGSVLEGAATGMLPFTTTVKAGQMLKPALTGAAAGLGAEAAGQASGDNPIARLLGGLIGGGAAAVGLNRTSNAEKVLKKSMQGLTEHDFERAARLEKTLNAEGIPHLKSGLLGNRTSLPDVAAAAATHPAARNKFLDSVRGMNQAADEAVGRWQTEHLAVGFNPRAEVLDDLQGTADSYLKKVKAGGNEAFRAQLPPGLDESHYTQAEMQNIYKMLSDRMMDPDAGPTSQVGARLKNLQARLIDKEATKEATRKAKEFVQQAWNTGDEEMAREAESLLARGFDPVTGEPLQRFITMKGHVSNLLSEINKSVPEAGMKGLPDNVARQVLREATPEYEAARAAKTQYMRDVYEPEAKGLVGDLARMGGGVKPDRVTATDQAFRIVFNPDRPQGAEIMKLSKQIGGDAVGELLREHITKTANNVFRTATEEEALKQPFTFTQTLIGTRAQRQNVEAAITAISTHYKQDPKAVLNGFHKLMRALDSTQFMQLPSQVDRAALAQELGESAASMVVAPHSRFGRWITEGAREKASVQIADIVTSPDGLQKLRQIALAKDPKLVKSVASSLLAATVADEPGAAYNSPGINP